MTPTELHEMILDKMNELRPNVTLHPLYKAILLESCENTTLLDQAKDFDENQLILTAMQLFEAAAAAMKGLLTGAAKVGDKINVNYRGETYTFNKNSSQVIDPLKG